MSGRELSADDATGIRPLPGDEPDSKNGERPHTATIDRQNAPDAVMALQLPSRTNPPGSSANGRDVATTATTQLETSFAVVNWEFDGTEPPNSGMVAAGGRLERGGAGVGHADARAVLLATKLHVAPIAGQLVRRAALLDTLSAGLDRKLTLLSAPAGSGKTTLLAQWVLSGDAERHFSWLSLDVSDNDPVWFWMYAIAALQERNPGVGARAFELLQMGADPLRVVLPNLLNEIAAIEQPMVLILDDYHLVVSKAVHEQLAFVIHRMPANLHIVLATRSDPLLPLARLRGDANLMEMRADDLRFGPDEADRLLNDVLGLDLTDMQIQQLCRRTEGWAAGLHLAALSLLGRSDAPAFITTFAGDNRHIDDYLMAEVLESQPPHIRDFLLRTSVLHRLSGDLCDAVLETTGSASILTEMERENLFVVPLDLSRHWYRYHQLFAELLRTELQRIAPDLVPVLHRRAAAWFEAHGLINEAVRHLLAAHDVARSADLIAAEWAKEFNAGGVSTVAGYLGLLPRETVAQDPRLGVAGAWIALHLGRLDDAADGIETLDIAAQNSATLAAQLTVLRAAHSFKTGHLAAALEMACQAITLELGDAPPSRANAYSIYGSALYFSRSAEQAHAAFRRSLRLAALADDRRTRITALGYLALISAESGQLADAERRIRRASGSSGELTDKEHLVDVMVSLATAILLHRHGDLGAAIAAADIATTSARKGGAILEVIKALQVKARILEHLGEKHAALGIRHEIDELELNRADDTSVSTPLTSAQPDRAGSAASRQQDHTADEELTPKELDILRLLATRLSRREIGERLFVSLNTVKTHQRAVYRKLRAENRISAVRRAHELGLL